MAVIEYPNAQQLEGAPDGLPDGGASVSSQTQSIFDGDVPSDSTMTNAADTQGPHPKADSDKHQKKLDDTGVDDGEARDGAQHGTKNPDERRIKKQREVVNRVLNCPDLDYYKILGVEETAKVEQIRQAFRHLSLLTHPDKCKVSDTTEAFRKISYAAQILSQKASRKQYDQNRSKYEQSGALEDATIFFAEEFADNAWATDDDDDDGDEDKDNQDEDTDTAPKKPDDFRLAIYRQATEFVNSFLNGDKDSRSKIEEFNQKIDAQNKKEGITGKEEFFIQDRVLEGLMVSLRAALGHYQTNPDEEKPVMTIAKLEEQLENTKKRYSYPNDWVLPIPEGLRARIQQVKEKEAKKEVAWRRQFGGAQGASSPSPPKENDKGKGRTTEFASHGRGEGSNTSKDKGKGRATEFASHSHGEGSNTSKDKGKGRATEFASHDHGESSNTFNNQGRSRGGGSSSAQGSSDAVSAWRPGLTEEGEKILGMVPYETSTVDRQRAILRCKFVVEKKGRTNPIEFVEDYDLGQRAVSGYLKQIPESERVDLRTKKNSYSRMDRANFDRILGVTPVFSNSDTLHPSVVILAGWKDGSKKLMNRAGFTDIWGTMADAMIEDFFVEKGLEIPWMKIAKRPGHMKSIEFGDYRETRAEAYRKRERSRRRETPRRTVDDHRRRSLSRSSSGSLSDDGFRRLEVLEERQRNMSKQLDEVRQEHKISRDQMSTEFRALAAQVETQMQQMVARFDRVMHLFT